MPNNKRRSDIDRSIVRANIRYASRRWAGELIPAQLAALRRLSYDLRLSLEAGEVQLIEGRWYVTHAGLLGVARRNKCAGLRVRPVKEFCIASANRWAFQATVYKTGTCKGFTGYGDADPTNVSSLVRGAEMRVAETRAVNRALRKAYGIGLCSVEEIGSLPRSGAAEHEPDRIPPRPSNGRGPMNLRNQLCQLIRQHRLDPALVKLYAAEFCGVQELRAASRDKVEEFVAHVADLAASDRDQLLSKLNGYAEKREGAA